MRQTIKTMSAMLTMMVAMAAFAFTFTACSDDDDPMTEVTYTYGFSSMSASHPDFLEEMSKIENSFKAALGVTGKPFSKKGSMEECDMEVYAACQKAYESLQGESMAGRLPIRDDKHPHRRSDMHGCVQCRQREHLRKDTGRTNAEDCGEVCCLCHEATSRFPGRSHRAFGLHDLYE